MPVHVDTEGRVTVWPPDPARPAPIAEERIAWLSPATPPPDGSHVLAAYECTDSCGHVHVCATPYTALGGYAALAGHPMVATVLAWAHFVGPLSAPPVVLGA